MPTNAMKAKLEQSGKRPGEATPLLSPLQEDDVNSLGVTSTSSSTSETQPLVLAALHVVEALKTQPTLPALVSIFELPSSSSRSYMKLYGLRRSMTGLRKTITTGLLLLTFVEPPRWMPEEVREREHGVRGAKRRAKKGIGSTTVTCFFRRRRCRFLGANTILTS